MFGQYLDNFLVMRARFPLLDNGAPILREASQIRPTTTFTKIMLQKDPLHFTVCPILYEFS